MDFNARVDVNFAWVDVNFQTVSVTLLILMPINIKVLLILQRNFQPNIVSHFGEMDLNSRVDIKFFYSILYSIP